MDTIQSSNGRGAATQPPALDMSQPLRLLDNQTEHWQNFKEPITFDEAAGIIADAHRADGDRDDLGVGDMSTWAFGPSPDGIAAIAPIPAPGRSQHLIPLRRHAFSQLCERAGAPPQYIRKLPVKLQMACMNHGMRQMDEKHRAGTLRLAGGSARAVLSDRYAALDDHLVLDVMETTLRAAGMLGDVRVRALATGPTMALRLTLPGEDIVVKSPQVGDVVEIGLDLLNGEIGNRAVSIAPMTYRLVCLNGMRRADRDAVSRLNHVGDPERLKEAFRDAVPSAIAASQGLRQRMETAVDRLVDDLLGEFNGLQAFGLTKSESRDVAGDVMAQRRIALPADTKEWSETFASIRDLTVYDVMNGVTHVAQSRSTDRRLEMEEGAARYLMNRTR